MVKPTYDYLEGELFMHKHTIEDISDLTSPFQFKGTIDSSDDFPTSAEVTNGWTYRVAADVTDNDASKTNTGVTFSDGDEIVWDGSTWVVIGNENNYVPYTGATKDVNLGANDLIITGATISGLFTPTYYTMQDQGGSFAAGINVNITPHASGLTGAVALGLNLDYSHSPMFAVEAIGQQTVAISGRALSQGAISIGGNSYTSGVNSISLGWGAFSLGDNSISIGNQSYSDSLRNISIGASTRTEANYAITIGSADSSHNITNNIAKSALIGFNFGTQENLLQAESIKGVRIGSTSGETITMDGDDLYVADELEVGGNLTITGSVVGDVQFDGTTITAPNQEVVDDEDLHNKYSVLQNQINEQFEYATITANGESPSSAYMSQGNYNTGGYMTFTTGATTNDTQYLQMNGVFLNYPNGSGRSNRFGDPMTFFFDFDTNWGTRDADFYFLYGWSSGTTLPTASDSCIAVRFNLNDDVVELIVFDGTGTPQTSGEISLSSIIGSYNLHAKERFCVVWDGTTLSLYMQRYVSYNYTTQPFLFKFVGSLVTSSLPTYMSHYHLWYVMRLNEAHTGTLSTYVTASKFIRREIHPRTG